MSSSGVGLEGPALRIVTNNDTRLRVLAGPGTGKSYTLKKRVARLLEGGQPPQRILAVTFTRNAAADLVQDLHTLGVEGCEKVRACTLHSFCFSLLNRQDVFEHLDRVPRPVVTIDKGGSIQFEGGTMLEDLGLEKDFGGKRECVQRLLAFEAAWARLQSDQPGWAQTEVDSRFQDNLIAWLRFHRAMLIEELVPEALRFLRDNPSANVFSEFDHVIVDEYQDLNRAEQELINYLATNSSAAVVGDPNQSIYSFKHANPEGIEQFTTHHPGTHDETLAECYRCPTRVVGIANSLISHNAGSGLTSLQPIPRNTEGEVHVVQWETSGQENEGIVSYIKELIYNRGFSPSDILVLTPRKQKGYQIRDFLKNSSIPAYSFFHEEALEKPSAQIAFTLLGLLSDPDDRVALRWWLGHGDQNSRRNAYQALRQHCENLGVSPREALDSIDKGDLKIPGTNSLLRQYQRLNEIISELQRLDLPQLVNQLFPTENPDLAGLRESADLVISEAADVSELFDHMKTHITQPEVPSGEFVRVMSLHKSKGLTSAVTIVTGCIQGLIPFIRDGLKPVEYHAQLEEQRRLFYVAITRCTDVLVVSSFSTIPYVEAKRTNINIRRSGWMAATITSQFIDEMGQHSPAPKAGLAWEASGYQ